MVAKKTVYSALSGKVEDDVLQELSCFIDCRKDSRRLIEAFEKWVTPLKQLGISFSASDFIRCASHKSFFKQTANLSRSFYEIRYDGFDIDKIWEYCKKSIIDKRGNSYDVDNVMKKLGVTHERASEIVQERLLACRQDLSSFVARHGEELGTEKYNIFLEKSKTTQENYKKRYGDAWQEKWDHFKATRVTRSLDHFVDKFGEVEGKKRFEKCNHDYSRKMSLEYLVLTLGEEEGKREFARRNAKKDSSSREGVRRTLLRRLGRAPSEEEVEKAYFENRKKKSSVYQILIKKFSLDEAEQKYLLYKEKNMLSDDIASELIGKMSMPTPKFLGPCSKQSCSLFSDLESALGRTLIFGSKSKEISLYDEERCKLYYYDCFDESSNTILEFNGSAFHPHPDLNEDERKAWFTISGQDAERKQQADSEKVMFASKSGYNVQVVWDREVKLKHDREAKIKQLVTVLNENQKNLKQC